MDARGYRIFTARSACRLLWKIQCDTGSAKNDPPSGRVRIHSWLENDVHRVEIADNGIGFDVGEAMDKEGVHIGLVNTKKRIELMCGGSMDIESKPGEAQQDNSDHTETKEKNRSFTG